MSQRKSIKPKSDIIVPSEEKVVFSTGAIRNREVAGIAGKFPRRYSLLNPTMLRRLAETYGEGSLKYGDTNWWKGMPETDLLDHALAHVFEWMAGDRSEDHLAHACWGFGALMHFQETRPELLNLQQAIMETGFYLFPEARAVLLQERQALVKQASETPMPTAPLSSKPSKSRSTSRKHKTPKLETMSLSSV